MIIAVLVMVLVVVLMVGFNALYVAGEFAAVSARKTRIIQEAKEGNHAARALLPVLEDPHRLDNYIAASQVGITLSSIVLGIYGQRAVAPLLEPLLLRLPFIDEQVAAAGAAAIFILILFTTLQVVFGELIPKSLAIQYPERVAKATVYPMSWSANWLLRPLIAVLNGSGALLLRLMSVAYDGGHAHVHSPEEIQLLIQQSYKGGLLDARGQELLTNAFRISNLSLKDILVPRTQIVAMSVDTPIRDALRFIVECRYTRIPVYRENLDQILGFTHAKDLFRLFNSDRGGESNLERTVRKVSFLPQSMLVREAWNVLGQEHHYLAIVVNESGKTVGMITQEDLLEELFGELEEEFDQGDEALVRPVGDGQYVIAGQAPVGYLNTRFSLDLPPDGTKTVSSFVLDQLKRSPRPGDQVRAGRGELLVETVRNEAIERVLLRLPGNAVDHEEEGK